MKVLFLDTVHPILARRFSEAGMTCIDATDVHPLEGVRQHPDATGIVLRSRIRVDADLLDRLPDLRFICRSGSGLENIDVGLAEMRGIRVFNSPEGNRDAVGEHALGLLLSLMNLLREADVSVKAGQWDREGHRGMEISGRTVGILGYGHMGSAFAEKLQGFGCRLLACDPYRDDHDGALGGRVEAVDLTTLQREADILSLHCNLTPETRGLVDREFLSGFAKPIVLLNTARGPVVRTADLLDALIDGRVTAAGLDVFEREASSFETVANEGDAVWTRLMAHPRVQVSPHVAGWTEESYAKLSSVLADKVLAEFGG
ncbi:MAG: NAD(P)-dependent oxidoreductase [Bacteroidota bacterium]|nr:NAD(P)-dependent oxidoreductase [Bacteroidota bacterium]MEC8597463.1 NAD(P)-dependent oxidoreductase [Bacteroidota bacterium]